MKRMNKNIGMRQRVRILETGQLGTVTDQQLMKRNGEVHRYLQVQLDDQPHLDIWFWDDKLGGTKETCRVTLEDATNTYRLDITRDHENWKYDINVHSDRNDNTEHVRDLSFKLVELMLIAMGAKREDVLRVKTMK